VSICPGDDDEDFINNNVDNDNDGITNCTESYGNKALPVSSSSGTISIGTYSNSFTGNVNNSGTGTPGILRELGGFTTLILARKTNASYKMISHSLNSRIKYSTTLQLHQIY
jgi:hypothetical protein